MVESSPEKAGVGGSIPPLATIQINHFHGSDSLLWCAGNSRSGLVDAPSGTPGSRSPFRSSMVVRGHNPNCSVREEAVGMTRCETSQRVL